MAKEGGVSEQWQAILEFGSTPNGRIIMIVGGIIVVAVILVPLWNVFRNLVKACLWGLLVLVVLAAAAAALWWWMSGDIQDPERRENMRQKASDLVHQGIGTNFGTLFPSRGGTNDAK